VITVRHQWNIYGISPGYLSFTNEKKAGVKGLSGVEGVKGAKHQVLNTLSEVEGAKHGLTKRQVEGLPIDRLFPFSYQFSGIRNETLQLECVIGCKSADCFLAFK
jgi:hypothetical protein